MINLYEFLKLTQEGYDMSDNIYDYLIYIELDEQPKDSYDTFINFVTQHTNIDDFNPKTKILTCTFTDFVNTHSTAFTKFAQDNCKISPHSNYNRLLILEDLVNGNYTHEQYTQINTLLKENNNNE